MQIIPWKNLLIYSIGSGEAVIWTDGGYTPRRGLLPGSGKTSVPPGVKLIFPAQQDTAGDDSQAGYFISGLCVPAVVEIAQPREIVDNYSHSVSPTDRKQPLRKPIRDYIVTKAGAKAHLK